MRRRWCTEVHRLFLRQCTSGDGRMHGEKIAAAFALRILSYCPFRRNPGKIVRVADGDTVTVLDALDGAPFRIRLDKIDAPELRQPFGPEAAAISPH